MIAAPNAKRPRDRSRGRFLILVNLRLSRHALSDTHILINLIEVQVFVDPRTVFVDDARGFVALGHCGKVTQL